jgi:hypothetical protein
VASSPLRPFVPQGTPTRPRPAVGSSEFRLARPFVPGAEPARNETIQPDPAPSASAKSESAASLQSIQDFLHRASANPAVAAGPQSKRDEFSAEFDEASAELPPVEHFLDPLPGVGEFEGATPHSQDMNWGAAEATSPASAASETPESEWAITDWQKYDWRSVAALGEAAETDASNAWATTDWDAAGPGAAHAPKNERPTVEQAIAKALEQIAQRIKSGELAAPMPGSATDPATIAATLAALLGIRH